MRSYAVESIFDLTTIVHSQGTINPKQNALCHTSATNLPSQIIDNQAPNNSWLSNHIPAHSTKTSGLKVGFLNAASLKKHIWAFREYLTENESYYIFGVAETRLGHRLMISLQILLVTVFCGKTVIHKVAVSYFTSRRT